MSHDDLTGRTDKHTNAIIDNCDDILRLLHVRYGVRHILFEATDSIAARIYNRDHHINGLMPRNYTSEFIEKTLNAYHWTLIPGADEHTPPPRINAARECAQNIERIITTARKEGWFSSPATLEPNQDDLLKQMQTVSDAYDRAMEPIIANDPDGSKEYAHTVSKRDDVYINNAMASGAPTVMLIGAAHHHDLTTKMKERGRPFYVIVPERLAWPQNTTPDLLRSELVKAARPPSTLLIKADNGQEARIKLNYRNAGK
jgi:hypothetical protein